MESSTEASKPLDVLRESGEQIENNMKTNDNNFDDTTGSKITKELSLNDFISPITISDDLIRSLQKLKENKFDPDSKEEATCNK